MSRIHFLNVEEGDCSIIEHNNKKVTMIDICCGNLLTETSNENSSLKEASFGVKGNFNQGAHPTNPISYLKNLGIETIFRYIQTHPDMDHMDGLDELYQNFRILNFWDINNSNYFSPMML